MGTGIHQMIQEEQRTATIQHGHCIKWCQLHAYPVDIFNISTSGYSVHGKCSTVVQADPPLMI